MRTLMRITSTLIRKIIAVYLIVGGLCCLLFFINTIGIPGYFRFLFPAVVTTFILLFYITCGVYYLKAKGEKFSADLMTVALLMQSIQFLFFGISFNNYFGPYLGLGIAFESSFDFFLKFRLFSFQVSNGISSNSDSLNISLNFLPITVLFFIEYLGIREKQFVHDEYSGFLHNDQLENT